MNTFTSDLDKLFSEFEMLTSDINMLTSVCCPQKLILLLHNMNVCLFNCISWPPQTLIRFVNASHRFYSLIICLYNSITSLYHCFYLIILLNIIIYCQHLNLCCDSFFFLLVNKVTHCLGVVVIDASNHKLQTKRHSADDVVTIIPSNITVPERFDTTHFFF